MSLDKVSILDGNTFLVTDRRGDVEPSSSDPTGLFKDDTRFLSKWILTVDGIRPSVLSIENLNYYEVQHFLVPSTGTVYINSPVSVIRRHQVSQGFVERLSVLNHSDQPRAFHVRIALDSDFADLFEVKDTLPKKGELYRAVDGGDLTLGYRRGPFVRESRIHSDVPAEVDADGLNYRITVPPHGEW